MSAWDCWGSCMDHEEAEGEGDELMKSSLCVHVPSRDCSMLAPDAWTDSMRGGVKKRK